MDFQADVRIKINFCIQIATFDSRENVPVVMIDGPMDPTCFKAIVDACPENSIEFISKTQLKCDPTVYKDLVKTLQRNLHVSSRYRLMTIRPSVLKLVAKKSSDKFIHDKINHYEFPPKTWDAIENYQKDTIVKAIQCKGRLMLGDEMGLGKSLQAIGIYLHYKAQDKHEFSKVVVVCEKSQLSIWSREMQKWANLDPENPKIEIIKTGKQRMSSLAEVTITTYDIARTRLTEIGVPSMVIMDEAEVIKNPKTKKASQLVPWLLRVPYVLLLTGTPMPNRPNELYVPIKVLFGEKTSGTWKEFTERYCDAFHDERYHTWDASGTSRLNIGELRDLLSTKMIRRFTKDVLDLPPLVRDLVMLDTDQECKDVTAELNKKAREIRETHTDLESGYLKNIFLQKMKNVKMEKWRATGILKLPGVYKWLRERLEKPGKFLVFADSLEVHGLLETFMKEHHVKYALITGDVKEKERYRLVGELANPDSSVRVGLLSLKACSKAFTFSPGATEVVFAEMPWTPSRAQQAERRVYRHNTTSSVKITYLLAKGTVDETLYQALRKKYMLFDKIINKGKNKKGFAPHNKKRFKLEEEEEEEEEEEVEKEKEETTTSQSNTLEKYFTKK
ncbi:MAG: DEAD/DEAH box helicase [Promethearchaeota archaeon]